MVLETFHDFAVNPIRCGLKAPDRSPSNCIKAANYRHRIADDIVEEQCRPLDVGCLSDACGDLEARRSRPTDMDQVFLCFQKIEELSQVIDHWMFVSDSIAWWRFPRTSFSPPRGLLNTCRSGRYFPTGNRALLPQSAEDCYSAVL